MYGTNPRLLHQHDKKTVLPFAQKSPHPTSVPDETKIIEIRMQWWSFKENDGRTMLKEKYFDSKSCHFIRN
jgi:hypothetical protein